MRLFFLTPNILYFFLSCTLYSQEHVLALVSGPFNAARNASSHQYVYTQLAVVGILSVVRSCLRCRASERYRNSGIRRCVGVPVHRKASWEC